MSLANYIIICDGRIDAAAAKNGFELIQAASRTATELVKFNSADLTESDAEPISRLQHQMMEVMTGRAMAGTKASGYKSASELSSEMFALLEKTFNQ